MQWSYLENFIIMTAMTCFKKRREIEGLPNSTSILHYLLLVQITFISTQSSIMLVHF